MKKIFDQDHMYKGHRIKVVGYDVTKEGPIELNTVGLDSDDIRCIVGGHEVKVVPETDVPLFITENTVALKCNKCHSFLQFYYCFDDDHREAQLTLVT